MRLVSVFSMALMSLLFIAPGALAAPCGVQGDGSELNGALTLKAGESDIEVNAERKTSERRLIFVFDVENCSLPAGAEISAKVRSSDVPPAAFGEPIVEPERTVLTVQVPVKPAEFEPGKYSAVVSVGGPVASTSVSKVVLQRSENRWWIPLLIAVIGGIVGVIWAMYTAWLAVSSEAGKEKLKTRYLPLAVFGGVVGALLIYKATYLDSEVWETEFSTGATLFLGAATAAAGASTVAAFTKVFGKEEDGK
jgi:hypothetical protein